jgi:hypothetical protein
MNNARIYPGMLDHNTEIFNHVNKTMAILNGEVIPFNRLPYLVLERLKIILNSDKGALQQVKAWYPNSEIDQLKKFASCRFGGLDFTPDLGDDHQDGEYWDCPMRGSCVGEGVVCKNVRYKGQEILPHEVRLLKAIATNDTNQTIAENLGIPYGSLHGIKSSLYRKLGGAQTKPQVLSITRDLNIT